MKNHKGDTVSAEVPPEDSPMDGYEFVVGGVYERRFAEDGALETSICLCVHRPGKSRGHQTPRAQLAGIRDGDHRVLFGSQEAGWWRYKGLVVRPLPIVPKPKKDEALPDPAVAEWEQERKKGSRPVAAAPAPAK